MRNSKSQDRAPVTLRAEPDRAYRERDAALVGNQALAKGKRPELLRGLELRNGVSKESIRMQFMWKDMVCRETLKPHTKSNIEMLPGAAARS